MSCRTLMVKPRAQLVKVVPLRMQAKTGLSRVLRAVAAGMDPAAAAVKAGLQDCWEMSWSAIKNWPSWKDSSSSRRKSQGRCAKSAWQEERNIGGQEEMTALEKPNLWNRIKPVECDFGRERTSATSKVAATNIFSSRHRNFSSR